LQIAGIDEGDLMALRTAAVIALILAGTAMTAGPAASRPLSPSGPRSESVAASVDASAICGVLKIGSVADAAKTLIAKKLGGNARGALLADIALFAAGQACAPLLKSGRVQHVVNQVLSDSSSRKPAPVATYFALFGRPSATDVSLRFQQVNTPISALSVDRIAGEICDALGNFTSPIVVIRQEFSRARFVHLSALNALLSYTVSKCNLSPAQSATFNGQLIAFLATNEVTATDLAPPLMQPVAVTPTGNVQSGGAGEVLISWSASDAGSGVKEYYVWITWDSGASYDVLNGLPLPTSARSFRAYLAPQHYYQIVVAGSRLEQ
jgi:hypothetical protein